MKRKNPAEAGSVQVGTCTDCSPKVRGSVIRVAADPELVAAEVLERVGPAVAAVIGAELVRLAAEVAR